MTAEKKAPELKPVKAKFLTFVVEIVDKTEADKALASIWDSFKEDRVVSGLRTTGMSNEDEMSKVESLEAQVSEFEQGHY